MRISKIVIQSTISIPLPQILNILFFKLPNPSPTNSIGPDSQAFPSTWIINTPNESHSDATSAENASDSGVTHGKSDASSSPRNKSAGQYAAESRGLLYIRLPRIPKRRTLFRGEGGGAALKLMSAIPAELARLPENRGINFQLGAYACRTSGRRIMGRGNAGCIGIFLFLPVVAGLQVMAHIVALMLYLRNKSVLSRSLFRTLIGLKALVEWSWRRWRRKYFA